MSAKKKAAAGRGSKAGSTKAKARSAKHGAKSAAKRPVAKKVVAKKKVAAKKIVAKKVVAKTKGVAKKAAKAKPAKPVAIKRRDGAGHLDPKYAADLRARTRQRPKDNERAFGNDALSRELGKEYVETVTSGEDEGNELRDKRTSDEVGGPFTVTTGGTEFAGGVDGSNPKSATREPFPRT